MFKSSLFWTLSGLVALVTLGVMPQAAQAAPITYTLSGQGSGTFNGTIFTDQAFTVTGVGDTANLTTISGFNLPAVPLSAMSFTINGFATATASTQMYMSNLHSLVPNNLFFGDSLANPAFLRFLAAGAKTWNVISDLGPLSVSQAIGLTGGPTETNLGPVTVSSITGPTTFTASLGAAEVPEPSTLVMLGLGLCVVARRRK